MGFRTIVIDSHSKLEYSLNFLIFKTAETTKRILLDEINNIVITSTAVAITTSLLSELSKRKINVIFCDEKRNPISELVPIYDNYNSYKKITEQIKWDGDSCNNVWARIVKQKILNQANSLYKRNKVDVANQLVKYANEVELGDITNREGHAAKVYFNNIYHQGFCRNDDSIINAYLNYGYSLILSLITRTIVSYGYLTQLGIHHRGETNPFNLSSDIIESFRFLVDDKVFELDQNDFNFKDKMIDLLNINVFIDGKQQSLFNAVSIHFLSVVDAIRNNNPEKIKFISSIEHEIG